MRVFVVFVCDFDCVWNVFGYWICVWFVNYEGVFVIFCCDVLWFVDLLWYCEDFNVRLIVWIW